MPKTTVHGKKLSSVKLNWNEVYYTNCPLVSASNVDQELGWTNEECKKLGVQYLYLHSRKESDWYPHYVHNLDWTLQVANIPAAITCTDVMAEKHPELVVAFMKGMIKVGRWANEHQRAAAAILDKQTFYRDVEDTYEGIKPIDLVPNLSPKNLVQVEIGKDFMLSHGYIKNDFDVQEWAAPEFLEQAARELIDTSGRRRPRPSCPRRPICRRLRGGSDRLERNRNLNSAVLQIFGREKLSGGIEND